VGDEVGKEIQNDTPVIDEKEENAGEEKEELYEESRTCSRTELAEWLHRIAEQVAGGAVTVGTATVPLPEVVKVEFEYEEKDGKKELEIEVEWSG